MDKATDRKFALFLRMTMLLAFTTSQPIAGDE